MEDENLKTRYNVMHIPSLDAFAKMKGGINHGCKDVYFIRAVGVNQTLAVELEKMDQMCIRDSQSDYSDSVLRFRVCTAGNQASGIRFCGK